MKILLTNDDGINADGIYAIYKELKKIGTVIIVAPNTEKSSVGHGITLFKPLFFKKMVIKGKFTGYAVNGTPADCVKFATSVLKAKPDVVVSGINLGNNEGCSVFYSGTVAAAREGALSGIPSIAVSLATFVDPDFRYAAKIGAKYVKLVHKNKLKKGTFLNINVPNVVSSRIKGIRITKQGKTPIHGEFLKKLDPSNQPYYWMTGKPPIVKKDDGSDIYLLKRNYVTVTPIHCDLTDYDSITAVSQWK